MNTGKLPFLFRLYVTVAYSARSIRQLRFERSNSEYSFLGIALSLWLLT